MGKIKVDKSTKTHQSVKKASFKHKITKPNGLAGAKMEAAGVQKQGKIKICVSTIGNIFY